MSSVNFFHIGQSILKWTHTYTHTYKRNENQYERQLFWFKEFKLIMHERAERNFCSQFVKRFFHFLLLNALEMIKVIYAFVFCTRFYCQRHTQTHIERKKNENYCRVISNKCALPSEMVILIFLSEK